MSKKNKNRWLFGVIAAAFIGYVVTDLSGCIKAEASEIRNAPEKIEAINKRVVILEKEIEEDRDEIKEAKEAAIRAELASKSNGEKIEILIELLK